MPTNYISDNNLADAVAAFIGHQSRTTLPTHATSEVIPWAATVTSNKIRERLKLRGYTDAQISGWDALNDFCEAIGTYWSMTRLSTLVATDTWVEKQNWIAQLDTVGILVDGVLVLPDPTGGTVGYGDMVRSSDIFSLDTEW